MPCLEHEQSFDLFFSTVLGKKDSARARSPRSVVAEVAVRSARALKVKRQGEPHAACVASNPVS